MFKRIVVNELANYNTSHICGLLVDHHVVTSACVRINLFTIIRFKAGLFLLAHKTWMNAIQVFCIFLLALQLSPGMIWLLIMCHYSISTSSHLVPLHISLNTCEPKMSRCICYWMLRHVLSYVVHSDWIQRARNELEDKSRRMTVTGIKHLASQPWTECFEWD